MTGFRRRRMIIAMGVLLGGVPLRVTAENRSLKTASARLQAGDKKGAWEILAPLAQHGDLDACHMLGKVLVESPEINGMERGKALLRYAAAHGHAGAKLDLQRIQSSTPAYRPLWRAPGASKENSVFQEVPAAPATTTKRQASPSQSSQSDLYHAQIEEVKHGGISIRPWRVLINVFTMAFSEEVERFVLQMNAYASSASQTALPILTLVADKPEDFKKASETALSANDMPMGGVVPDLGGLHARRFGMTKFPSVLFLSRNGGVERLAIGDAFHRLGA